MARAATQLEAAVSAVLPTAFELVPVEAIRPSPLNPRKRFDPEKHKELVESVRAKGVIVPVMLRPHAGGGYELAYGERRYRAAKEAGLTHLPALVRALEDREVLEVAVMENVERADMTPLEEGAAYRQLVAMGLSVEDLVKKTGVKRGTIYGRMKLAELDGPAREAVDKGDLHPSIGLLIARLPTKQMQEDAFEALEDTYGVSGGLGKNLTYEDAEDLLQDQFRLVLKDAPFSLKDANLVPGCGACTDCPKRTGATPELFKDVKHDTCLDPVCWKQKLGANAKALKEKYSEKAEKGGVPLLPAKALKDTQYVDLSKEIHDWGDGGRKTVKAVLGKDAPEASAVVIDSEGQAHMLVKADEARAALKKIKKENLLNQVAPKPQADTHSDYEAERKKQEEQRDRRTAVAAKAVAEIAERVESSKETAASFLRVYMVIANVVPAETYKKRGWKNDEEMEAALRNMPEPKLRALLVESSFSSDPYAYWHNYPNELQAACKRFGVDLKKLEAAEKEKAKQTEKPEEKPTPAKAKKGKK